MAIRKKKINPVATVLTIAALGITGWAVYKFFIKPALAKRRVGTSAIIDADINETMDANFEIIDNNQTA
tara:strand:- start:529 stop:735 length:207 start_codon:yes stop_codon:yes gene_type:complete